MKRSRKFISFYLFLCLFEVIWMNRGYCQPTITTYDSNVTSEEVDDIQTGIDATMKFFYQSGFISLYDIKVIAASENSYENALIDYGHMDPKQAAIKASQSSGIYFNNGVIVLNIKKSMTKAARVYIIAHELTHYMQVQTCKEENLRKMYWLIEGSADAIAAKVVENCELGKVKYFQEKYNIICVDTGQPLELKKVETQKVWNESDQAFTYSFASSATLLLTEKHGYQSIFEYFKLLSNNLPDVAFNSAFREDYNAFSGSIKNTLYFNYAFIRLKQDTLLMVIFCTLIIILIYKRFNRVAK